MGLQFTVARAVSAVSTWGLKNVFRRPAANFPGKMALYIDPRLIADMRPKLTRGSVVVVGTNGKTTVTNLLADVLEQGGQRVVCNRTGANLDSGVATALLHAKTADWGVFETDELWLAKILPHLRANYVVLLNLFRDQLDRVGEIDRIQDSIVGALASSPETVLVYNADDPLCAAIATRAKNASIAFGISDDMGLPQNTVSDATMCQQCSTMFEYAFRQYGQLGDFHCPNCGFARPALDYAAEDVRLSADGLSFELRKPQLGEAGKAGAFAVKAPFSGAYMVYNVAAVAVATSLLGCSNDALQQGIDAFNPQNGRLQMFEVHGRRALLNLAKNPTGFNQNIKIILQDEGPKAVAFFVNDKEGDGRDVSWLWDVDFEELASVPDLRVFAGGIRKNDVQVRLKYAGLDAALIDGASAMFERLAETPTSTNAYLIANYTALPPVHAELGKLAAEGAASVANSAQATPPEPDEQTGVSQTAEFPENGEASLVIAHLFPDLLNLYGDGGNVSVLAQRARRRGIPVEVVRVNHGEQVDLEGVDLVFLGGGPDREQRLASEDLMRMREALHAYVEDDGVLLAICGGYQILGREWLLGDETVQGLGILDLTTRRAEDASDSRLIGDIALRTATAERAVVGYENHAGRTYVGEGVEAFGEVVSSGAGGNNGQDKYDGVRYRNVVGTYLHGPLLPKNPEIADDLLVRALARRANRTGVVTPPLVPLDDAPEIAANEYLCKKLNIASF